VMTAAGQDQLQINLQQYQKLHMKMELVGAYVVNAHACKLSCSAAGSVSRYKSLPRTC
jgi:hypothetical protein